MYFMLVYKHYRKRLFCWAIWDFGFIEVVSGG